MFLNPSLYQTCQAGVRHPAPRLPHCVILPELWKGTAVVLVYVTHRQYVCKRVILSGFLFIVELFAKPTLPCSQPLLPRKMKILWVQSCESFFSWFIQHHLTHIIRCLSLPGLTFGRKSLFQRHSPFQVHLRIKIASRLPYSL